MAALFEREAARPGVSDRAGSRACGSTVLSLPLGKPSSTCLTFRLVRRAGYIRNMSRGTSFGSASPTGSSTGSSRARHDHHLHTSRPAPRDRQDAAVLTGCGARRDRDSTSGQAELPTTLEFTQQYATPKSEVVDEISLGGLTARTSARAPDSVEPMLSPARRSTAYGEWRAIFGTEVPTC